MPGLITPQGLRVSGVTFRINGTALTVGLPFIGEPPEGVLRLIHWMTVSITEEGAAESMHWAMHDGSIHPDFIDTASTPEQGAVEFTDTFAMDNLTMPMWAFGSSATPTSGNNQTVMQGNPLFSPAFETVNQQWLILHTLDAQVMFQRFTAGFTDHKISRQDWVQRKHIGAVHNRTMGQITV